ncbi:hypothetical protein [Enterococcus rivorum]|uniref:hypothetical protein n=1 Tax=Enterococcus rivorum TaxID=762845 RepID=UPI0036258FCE
MSSKIIWNFSKGTLTGQEISYAENTLGINIHKITSRLYRNTMVDFLNQIHLL